MAKPRESYEEKLRKTRAENRPNYDDIPQPTDGERTRYMPALRQLNRDQLNETIKRLQVTQVDAANPAITIIDEGRSAGWKMLHPNTGNEEDWHRQNLVKLILAKDVLEAINGNRSFSKDELNYARRGGENSDITMSTIQELKIERRILENMRDSVQDNDKWNWNNAVRLELVKEQIEVLEIFPN